MTKAKQPKTQSDPRDQQIQDLQNRLARALADYQNLEKRYTKDSASIVKFANATLLEKLLEVRDHLGMATTIGTTDQSLKMILSSFDKILTDEGVREVDVSGQFDPATMECHESAPGAKDQIISVVRRGYTLHDRLLRPARVVVGNGDLSKPVSEVK